MYVFACVLSAVAATLVLIGLMSAMLGSGIDDNIQFVICAGVGYFAGLLVREVA